MNLYRPIPSNPHDWFTDGQIDESRRYNRGRQVLAIAASACNLAVLIAFIATRALDRLFDAIGASSWPVQLLVGLAVLMPAMALSDLPVQALSHRYERRWEFTDQAWPSWIAEAAKGFVLNIVLTSAIFAALWLTIRTTDLWWLFGALVFAVFSIGLAVLAPVVIMPLFNTFTPIEDESLRERVKRLGRESGVIVGDVYSMDASKQTRKDNAYFAGLGPVKRVVLYDNLLKQSPREVDSVLAHEISHQRRNHVAKKASLGVVLSLVLFFLISRVSGWDAFLDLLGVESFDEPAALPGFLLLFVLGFSVTSLLQAWLSRAFERQADLDSLEFTRDAQTFIDAHVGLAIRNLGELDPSWWHRVRGSHPPAAERLALGKLWQAQRLVTVLFTDIEDSTQLVERLGDRTWFEVRRDHDEIVRGKVAEHRGTEVDNAGDGFLIVFEDAGEALLCAIEVQRDLEDYSAHNPDAGLRVRMGLHCGEVVRSGRSVVGREVIVAARVAAAASGGEIVVSDAVKAALDAAGRFTFTDPRTVELKGLSGTHQIHRVDWTGSLSDRGSP